MFRRVIHILVALLSFFASVSCDKTIHEYPGERNVELVVRCSVDLTPPKYFTTVECDSEGGISYVVRTQGIQHNGTRFTEPVCLRYVVDLYRVDASHSQFVERQVLFASVDTPAPQVEAKFRVDAQRYRVLVWCDYVQEDLREAWYYNTDDLRRIVYTDVPVVDNNDKDAFTNVLDVDFTSYCYAAGDYEVVHDLSLERPNGKFKCVATDRDDYVRGGDDAEDITAVVAYEQYVSGGYNVEEQRPNYFEPTRTFVAKAHIDDSGELVLCYDYLFVNGKQTNVRVDLSLYKGDVVIDPSGVVGGELISQWLDVVVPLKRNMETIIEGRMLTTSSGTGGVGVDPSFDHEILIPWGD